MVDGTLLWDTTCVNTLAASYLFGTTYAAGAVTEFAESLKGRKYAALDNGCMFVPFGIETLGPWGPGVGTHSF